MKITNLIENTEGVNGCIPEHGLSFYIETKKHKILMDTGASDLILSNAEKMEVDLSQVDTVVLSHGHYDHSGGILPFASINDHAKIYMKQSALSDYYSIRSDGEHYIGIDKKIASLLQLSFSDSESDCIKDSNADGDARCDSQIFTIDDELSLFSGIRNIYPIPSTNKRLKMNVDGEHVQDEFEHEQCLVISLKSCIKSKENEDKIINSNILLSGCAHHGILNIMERYIELYGTAPDAVISGFHLMKNGYDQNDIAEIEDIARKLMKYGTIFYTCHCTGVEPYEIMKRIMGDRLHYLHCGDELETEEI
ncbi:MAG: MBL fold metallo-hydrolase [Lachnospiraceae bacterium]|nr:MBL fold metallo-hydrolase [Lachnospiraceae bacterium]